MKLNQEKLQALTFRIDRSDFSDYRPEYPGRIQFNKRLKKVAGRYFPHDDHIEINPRLLKSGEAILVAMIKRELCQYYVHYHPRTGAVRQEQFRELLHTVGGREFTVLPKYLKRHRIVYNRFYRCSGCGHEVYYHQRFWHREHHKRCHRCADHLVQIGRPHKVVIEYSTT